MRGGSRPDCLPMRRPRRQRLPARDSKENVPVADETITVAVAACEAADDKKATDLSVLQVADLLVLVDLFVLATTHSDQQLKAVAEAIEQRLRAQCGRRPLRREGSHQSGWLLLDYGDVVCHLFGEEQRRYYSLERLWADVPTLDPATGRRLEAGRAAAR